MSSAIMTSKMLPVILTSSGSAAICLNGHETIFHAICLTIFAVVTTMSIVLSIQSVMFIPPSVQERPKDVSFLCSA